MKIKYFEDPKYKYLEPQKKQSVDLFLCYCGMENCTPSHSYGPAIRSQYLIHYIIDGEGSYTVNNTTYKLKKNQGFLICPNMLTYYEADKTNPWTYMWIGFNGIKAQTYLNYANLNEENAIFEYSKDDSLKNYIFEMFKLKEMDHSTELKLEGLLYFFMSKLVETRKSTSNQKSYKNTELYLEKSIEFIENNYSHNIKVNDIAKYIGINRSYLTNIFKKNINVSPQEFLVNYKIDKASELLKNTSLSIKSIAASVGYSDPLTFSKIFKKIAGDNPKSYREKNSSNRY
ncbi:AraC family transcriptional regulator [Clostridium saccharobutylicum]|uniref:Msm operon regulatory protein MsmR n=1 Tax=Clostridium saccharobutylicum DSM 13864 TaxID=1345695 RepID=U5MM86_CLOSA|nr:AraC family transcriptional regulator [Clostridium saccharobutylicum]AGX41879.1 Msm operon regulatory protein MsmR [Clostridium saccharobutylicum DSM 13864]AQR89153.1 arabinose operon regulatory protein [Clostridium saccharobutylicum]AQR99054.1 arabinose operon regulatory protein [Clostridium saccharobutylicum]AQS08777.1 arabinose operon regulatory protein [Clostridium saccharobutylicum]AQS13042.1 arabinose operon regulatory protein [Clostridium saccharobutylicum]